MKSGVVSTLSRVVWHNSVPICNLQTSVAFPIPLTVWEFSSSKVKFPVRLQIRTDNEVSGSSAPPEHAHRNQLFLLMNQCLMNPPCSFPLLEHDFWFFIFYIFISYNLS